MEEATLIKLALTCVLIGLPLLYFVSPYVDPGEYAALEKQIHGKVTRVVPGEWTKVYVEETRIVPVIVEEASGIEPGMIVDVKGQGQRDAFFATSITPSIRDD